MNECICKKLRECDEHHKASVVINREKSFTDMDGNIWVTDADKMCINHDETTLEPYAYIKAGFTCIKGHTEFYYGGSIITNIKYCPFCGAKLWGDEE